MRALAETRHQVLSTWMIEIVTYLLALIGLQQLAVGIFDAPTLLSVAISLFALLGLLLTRYALRDAYFGGAA